MNLTPIKKLDMTNINTEDSKETEKSSMEQKKHTEEELLAEIGRLKEFKEELIYLVDRLGGESGGCCEWNKETRDKMSAKEWSKIVYDFANELIEWEKSGVVHRAMDKIKE